LPGKSLNPAGKPKGLVGGRMAALAVLEKVLADEGNLEALRVALDAELQRDPARFFLRFVAPLLPTESRHEVSTSESSMSWVRISARFPSATDLPAPSP